MEPVVIHAAMVFWPAMNALAASCSWPVAQQWCKQPVEQVA
jgi:hypothetical protein